MKGAIYLDFNATTPLRPEAQAAIHACLNKFGNPSSKHMYGVAAKEELELARSRVAAALQAKKPSEVYFCGSGTEADNWAIWGSVCAYKQKYPSCTPHVVASAIEHDAVIAQLQSLKSLGMLDFSLIGVNAEGFVDIDEVIRAIRDDTCLISVMHSNNEIGTIQRIEELTYRIKGLPNKEILVFSDAAQSVGKVDVNVEKLGVDLLTVVGHKFGAPKGVAALYIREGVKIHPLLCGGGQESGLRSATENTLLIAAMGAAIAVSCHDIDYKIKEMKRLRDRLRRRLEEALPTGSVRVNGPTDAVWQLPNTLSVSIASVQAKNILEALTNDVAASAGSACHGGAVSGVLSMLGLPEKFVPGTLRLSVGFSTTEEEIDQASVLLLQAIRNELQSNA